MQIKRENNQLTMAKYTTIIWDWNGTLLNDVSICIKAMNKLLNKRGISPLTENRYRDVFTFPVRDYYEQIGFDFSVEEFDTPALKFIEYYQNFLPMAGLFPEVDAVLRQLKNNNINQYILSAMEHNSLLLSVRSLSIEKYFTAIAGIDNHFAKSKINRGIKLIGDMNIDRSKTLMVGDTLHDMEVAEALGINCVLVSQGHQTAKRLKVNGNTVINSLSELGHCL